MKLDFLKRHKDQETANAEQPGAEQEQIAAEHERPAAEGESEPRGAMQRAVSPLTRRPTEGERAEGAGATEAEPRDTRMAESGGEPRPDSPTGLEAGQWRVVVGETVGLFRDRGLNNWAAALTYFGVLALFPAIVALVSLLGIFGDGLVNPLIQNLATAAPGPARDLLLQAVTGVADQPEASGVLFVVGLLVALWAASRYVSAFMDASNDIYGVDEERAVWRRVPTRLAITALELTIIALCAIAVVLTADLATRAGDLLGVGDAVVDVWEIAKWPAMVVLVGLALAVLYWAAPNVKHPGFRWITPGSLAAIGIWIVASAGFALYLAFFGSYNQTYGALGGAVIFLIWLWISNMAVLFGAAMNARLELRGNPPPRQAVGSDRIAAGHPAGTR